MDKITEESKDVYLFRVSLPVDKSEPDWKETEIWRVIALRGTNTLVNLHNAIFKAFDREDEHMWSFFFGKPFKPNARTFVSNFEHQLQIEEYGENRYEKASKMKIEDLPLPKNGKFSYLFDYGDDWWHDIKFLGTVEAEPKTRYPKIVEKHGDSPPQYPDWEDEDDDEADEVDLLSPEEQELEFFQQIFGRLFEEEEIFRTEVTYDEAGREVVKKIPDPNPAFNKLLEENRKFLEEDPFSSLKFSDLEHALRPFKKASSAQEVCGYLRGILLGRNPVETKRLANLVIHQRKNVSQEDLARLIDMMERFRERFADEYRTGSFHSFRTERSIETREDYFRWMQGIADKVDGFFNGLDLSQADVDILDEVGDKNFDRLDIVEMFIHQLLEESPQYDLNALQEHEPMIFLIDVLAQVSIFQITLAFRREYEGSAPA